MSPWIWFRPKSSKLFRSKSAKSKSAFSYSCFFGSGSYPIKLCIQHCPTWWCLAANWDLYRTAAVNDRLAFRAAEPAPFEDVAELGFEAGPTWLLEKCVMVVFEDDWLANEFSVLVSDESRACKTELLRRVFCTTSLANWDWKHPEGESVAPRLSIRPCSSWVNSRISNSGLRLLGVLRLDDWWFEDMLNKLMSSTDLRWELWR